VSRERIERLHHLLHRVQVRAQEPRTNGVAYAPASVPPASAAPTYPPPAAAVTPEPASVEVEHESLPPQAAYAAAPEPQDAYLPSDDDADVEISSETVEVDIDIDEPMPMESGAQPIAQQTMPPEDLEDEVEEQPQATQPSVRAGHDEEVTQMAPPAPANEIEEPAPSSSRRPIAGEEVAETYGEESAPRHTPPPESGKQVAAPSVHPVAARAAEPSSRPSAAPPSLEGHTLIGGWREPGLGGPPAGGTGVRVAPPGEPAVPAQASGTRLSPDVTRPDLAATANVARFEGPAPVGKPTTLGELLDMTLSL
jgi:hypothetical protein